jgi:hypothetical protein
MMNNCKKGLAFVGGEKIGGVMMMHKKEIAWGEIFLLVSFSFAVAFILEENLVLGDLPYIDSVTGNTLDAKSSNLLDRYLDSFSRESAVASGPVALSPGTATANTITSAAPVANGASSNLGLGSNAPSFTLDAAKEVVAKGFGDAGIPDVLTSKARLGIGPTGTATSAAEAAAKAAASGLGKDVATQYGYNPFGIEAFRIGEGGLLGKTAFGGFAAHLVQGAVWGGVVSGIVRIAGSTLGLDEGVTDALSSAAFGGIMAYKGVLALGTESGGLGVLGPGSEITASASWIGLGVGIAIFVANYKKEKKELVRFECLPWEAPLGGAKCEECNGNSLQPCSEYRCKSLGQACEIVNPGTEEERCVWVHKDDVSAPKINVWDDALKPIGLEYVPDNKISPPNRGFNILKKPEGCLAAFTSLEFGITTDEPAQCRIDYEIGEGFDEMKFLFGESTLFLEEHTQRLKVPSPFEDGGAVPEIHNDGTYTLYTRCIDANGNGKDSAAVAFSFCVQPGPDVAQPIIEGTSIKSGSPVRFNANEVPIEVYINEPANCRWSKQDKSYELMENEMTCGIESYQINADLNYVCSNRLTGIVNRVPNNYYFRCQDLSSAPGGRNTMERSHKLVLEGSEELLIESVGPSGEFKGSSSVVEVFLTAETAHGANEGDATCYISQDSADLNSFIAMDNSGKFKHNQSLYLPSGEYTYHFKCIDAGGNTAEDSTDFRVIVDVEGPRIARVYRAGSGLKVITNEAAKCVYSLSTCNYNFEDGLPMLQENPLKKDIHFTDWDRSKTYHIKCRDLQGNQPAPNACNIVAKGSEL